MSESVRKKALFAAAIVLSVATTVAAGYFLMRPALQETIVETFTVTPHDINVYGEYDGRIRSRRFVEIHARVEGYLDNILFQEGAYVEKGKTLFIIDPRLYDAKANKARAQLNKAQAQARKALRDLERIKPLYAQNAASQLDLDNATTAYESAIADVAVSEADLTQAELTLGYTRISSPISGYISRRVADVGTHVGPSGGQSLLATISNNDTVGVDFPMTALDYLDSKRLTTAGLIGRDSVGQWTPTVSLILADGTEYPHKGTVDFAGPQVDPKTNTYSISAEVPNPAHSLLADETIKVRVLLDVCEDAIEIPTNAIVTEDDATFVYVVRPDNTVEKRAIAPGRSTGNSTTIVRRGLAAGEKVAVGDNLRLTDGSKVTIRQK